MMRDYVRAFLAPAGFPELDMDLMVLGLDEASTNIIRYAYDHEETHLIRLVCEKDPAGVTFRLRDHGRQCDPSMLQARPLEEIRPGGLGLHLIRRAFDTVEYVLHDVGTELVLKKSLPAPPAK